MLVDFNMHYWGRHLHVLAYMHKQAHTTFSNKSNFKNQEHIYNKNEIM